MKSLICVILVVLTWGESVDAYWQMMRDGKYDEAVTKIETYLTEGKRVSETERVEGAALVHKAQICKEMKESARKVEIVDSVKVAKDRMLETCVKMMQGCRVTMREDGGAEFVTTRGDKRLMSIKGSQGLDLYRQYGDDEKERLSDRVNTNSNENFPFEMSDGVTLYFASEGHGAIGGYDLFRTKYDSETFDYTEPQSVGMPFNSLGNDYLMMVDDIAGLGLWATDWRQTGDTVMVYVYKLEGKADGVSAKRKVEATQADDVPEEMRFIVNDTLVYDNVDDFRNAEAKGLYLEMKDVKMDVRLTAILLETMREGILQAESDEEAETLKGEILDNERYLMDLRKRLKDTVKVIRQLEIKEYE